MNILDLISHVANLLSIISFVLAILTYMNTQKIKSSDDWVSFRVGKTAILAGFEEKMGIIAKYTNINSDMELEPCFQAMKDVLDSVNRLKKYRFWNDVAKNAFEDFNRHEAQVKSIDALRKPYTDQNLKEITEVINNFISHLENVIAIVENQE